MATKDGQPKYYLLSEEACHGLLKYQYAGGDTSYVYKYVLSPLAEALVQFVPTWVAPNVITAFSFSTAILSCLLTAIYMPTFTEEAPRWVYALLGVNLLAYQTLDNMDGKQARRTRSGSALGMLFDHGCDAMNCTLSAVIMAAVTRGATSTYALWLLPATLFVPVLPFWIATWEEYHVGGLWLPKVNGPTEGVLFAAGCHFATALHGPAIWAVPSYGGFTRGELLIAGSGLAAVVTAVSQLVNVAVLEMKAKRSVLYVMLQHLPFAFLCAAAVRWYAVAPQSLVEAPRTAMLLFGCLFSEMVIALMLNHICDVPFEPARRPLMLLPLAVINAQTKWVPPSTFLTAYTMFAFLWLAAFLYTMIHEVCDVLDIDCFSSAKQRARAAAAESKKDE